MSDNRVQIFGMLHDIVSHKVNKTDSACSRLRTRTAHTVAHMKDDLRDIAAQVRTAHPNVDVEGYKKVVCRHNDNIQPIKKLATDAFVSATEAKRFYALYEKFILAAIDKYGESLHVVLMRQHTVMNILAQACKELRIAIQDLDATIKTSSAKRYGPGENLVFTEAVKKRDEKLTELAATEKLYDRVNAAAGDGLRYLLNLGGDFLTLRELNINRVQDADRAIVNNGAYQVNKEFNEFIKDFNRAQARLMAYSMEMKQHGKK